MLELFSFLFLCIIVQDAVGNSQFDEEGSHSGDDYSEESQGIILSESQPKKVPMSSFIAQVLKHQKVSTGLLKTQVFEINTLTYQV